MGQAESSHLECLLCIRILEEGSWIDISLSQNVKDMVNLVWFRMGILYLLLGKVDWHYFFLLLKDFVRPFLVVSIWAFSSNVMKQTYVNFFSLKFDELF